MRLKKGYRAEARKRPAPDAPRREKVGPEVLENMRWPMWHKVRIIHEVLNETQAGGKRQVVGLELTGSTAEGYVVWQGFNIDCPKNRAVESRAWEELGELFAAAGLDDKSDTRELVGLMVEAFLAVPKKAGFDPLEAKAFRSWVNEPLEPRPPEPPREERQVQPTGSHRYAEPEPGEDYEAEPEGSRTEWAPHERVQDADLDDDIPFLTAGYASTRSRRSPLASIVQVPW